MRTSPRFSSSMGGFSLVEVLLALGLTMLIAGYQIVQIKNNAEATQAKAVGQQMAEVGEALNTYLAMRYNTLVSASPNVAGIGTSADPGPRICNGAPSGAVGTSGATQRICVVTANTLRRNGILPNSFSGRNAYGANYEFMIRIQGQAPNYIVDGIVVTDKPYLMGGTTPRYDLLGAAMQQAGADAGMTRTVATKVEGLNGGWNESGFSGGNVPTSISDGTTTSTITPINQNGLFAYRVGYGTSGYASYLRLDGTTPMTGALDMGANDIKHVTNIDAAGRVNAKTLTVEGGNTALSLGYTYTRDANGNITATDSTHVVSLGNDATGSRLLARANQGLTVTMNDGLTPAPLQAGTTTVSALTANGDVTAQNFLTNGTVKAGSLTTTGDSTIGGKLTVGSDINAGGAVYVGGTAYGIQADATHSALGIVGDKNFYTGGNIRGGTVSSDGNLVVSNGSLYFLTGGAALGGACTGAGMTRNASTGSTMQCKGGVWTNISSGALDAAVFGTTVCGPSQNSQAICAAGHTVRGGGYQLTSGVSAAPDSNYPNGTSAWVVATGPAAPAGYCFRAVLVCGD